MTENQTETTPTEEVDFTGAEILIVDDNEQNRELLEAYLDNLPCTIRSAPDGVEALNDIAKKEPDLILLDNMSLEEMAEAVRERPEGVKLEASGNMKPGRLKSVAETGVDFISVGALTHSARAVDIALDVVPTVPA